MKKSKKLNQITIKKVICDNCNGNGTIQYGSCERSCCPPYYSKECCICNGLGFIKKKFKAILFWEEIKFKI